MKTRSILLSHLFSALILLLTAAARSVSAQSAGTIHEATLMESDQRTKEISTDELRKILAEKSATVFDARHLMNMRSAIFQALSMFRLSLMCRCHFTFRM